jgi:hypothetical protein
MTVETSIDYVVNVAAFDHTLVIDSPTLRIFKRWPDASGRKHDGSDLQYYGVYLEDADDSCRVRTVFGDSVNTVRLMCREHARTPFILKIVKSVQL